METHYKKADAGCRAWSIMAIQRLVKQRLSKKPFKILVTERQKSRDELSEQNIPIICMLFLAYNRHI